MKHDKTHLCLSLPFICVIKNLIKAATNMVLKFQIMSTRQRVRKKGDSIDSAHLMPFPRRWTAILYIQSNFTSVYEGTVPRTKKDLPGATRVKLVDFDNCNLCMKQWMQFDTLIAL